MASTKKPENVKKANTIKGEFSSRSVFLIGILSKKMQ